MLCAVRDGRHAGYQAVVGISLRPGAERPARQRAEVGDGVAGRLRHRKRGEQAVCTANVSVIRARCEMLRTASRADIWFILWRSLCACVTAPLSPSSHPLMRRPREETVIFLNLSWKQRDSASGIFVLYAFAARVDPAAARMGERSPVSSGSVDTARLCRVASPGRELSAERSARAHLTTNRSGA